MRLFEPTDVERGAARWLGLPAVIERSFTLTLTTALAHAWRERSGRGLVIQAGDAGSLRPVHCERLFRALLDFPERAGVLVGVRLAEPEEDVQSSDTYLMGHGQ